MKKLTVIGRFLIKYKYKILVLQLFEILSVITVSLMPYLNTKIYDDGVMERKVRVFVNAILLYCLLGIFNIYISSVMSIMKSEVKK